MPKLLVQKNHFLFYLSSAFPKCPDNSAKTAADDAAVALATGEGNRAREGGDISPGPSTYFLQLLVGLGLHWSVGRSVGRSGCISVFPLQTTISSPAAASSLFAIHTVEQNWESVWVRKMV